MLRFSSRLIFIPCKCCWLCVFRTVCKPIDVQNFRHVISNPDAWAVVENRDQCKGLYRNGTISWLGPHNFARVFKVCRTPSLKLRSPFFLFGTFMFAGCILARLPFFISLAVTLHTHGRSRSLDLTSAYIYLFLHLFFNRFFAPPGRDQSAT
jgi:hypothetical protein